MGISTSEWLAKVGDENISIQNLRENMTNIRLVKKGREVEVTFVTGPNFITPNDVAAHRESHVGLVIWVPKELSDKALGK